MTVETIAWVVLGKDDTIVPGSLGRSARGARMQANTYDRSYPHMGPHRVIELIPRDSARVQNAIRDAARAGSTFAEPFRAGYQTACEEIAERLGLVYDDLESTDGAATSGSAAAVPAEAATPTTTTASVAGDGEALRRVAPATTGHSRGDAP